MNKLTIEALKGVTHVETVEIKSGNETYSIEVKPLNHLLAMEIKAQLSKSIHMKSTSVGKKMNKEEMEVSLSKVLMDQAAARVRACALATTDPQWTEQTINEFWRTEWIEKVSKVVFKISGIKDEVGEAMEEEEEKQNFRGDRE